MSFGSNFGKFYKVARWVVLAALIVVILLILKTPKDRPDPLEASLAKESAESFSTKLAELEAARRENRGAEARLTADEINASFSSPEAADAIRAQAQAQAGGTAGSQTSPSQPEQTAEEAAKNIKSVQVTLNGDEVTGYFIAPVYGQDVSVRISGRLGASNGYVTFEPTGFRVGELDVPVSLVNPALQKKLQEPETHEKLRLPDFINGVRVENGELVISEAPVQ